MIRAGINGFGRIGRALFRINAKRRVLDVVAINDINPDKNNLAYLLQYDSEYGRFAGSVESNEKGIIVDGSPIAVFHEERIANVPWESLGVDIVIDCSGVHENVIEARSLIERGIPKVVITHSPDEVDHTIILGVNEDSYDHAQHNVISSSICDAVAVAPVVKAVDEEFGVESGFLTTLHPWLSYQNLLDGPSVSWANPGKIYHHYAVGRASTRGLIPKPTTAIEAMLKVLPRFRGAFKCMSFRVPTPVVGAANLYMRLRKDAEVGDVKSLFRDRREVQSWPIIDCTADPLVSVDFLGSEYSATVDERWIDLAGKRHLYLVLWYDNEWGYANHCLSLAEYLMKTERKKESAADGEMCAAEPLSSVFT